MLVENIWWWMYCNSLGPVYFWVWNKSPTCDDIPRFTATRYIGRPPFTNHVASSQVKLLSVPGMKPENRKTWSAAAPCITHCNYILLSFCSFSGGLELQFLMDWSYSCAHNTWHLRWRKFWKSSLWRIISLRRWMSMLHGKPFSRELRGFEIFGNTKPQSLENCNGPMTPMKKNMTKQNKHVLK